MNREIPPSPREVPHSYETVAPEIERRFLLTSLPEQLETAPYTRIRQGYLAGNRRVRQEDDYYSETIKEGQGLVRMETSRALTRQEFDMLWQKTKSARLEKTRYRIPYQGVLIEVDLYHGALEGFMTAEVEFKSKIAARSFEPPSWFGRELTGDNRYSNYDLARVGVPQEEAHRLIKTYELAEGKRVLFEHIQKEQDCNNCLIVAIAGGSASGKTSAVASQIADRFGNDAAIISMDDYYKGVGFMQEEASRGRTLNWDEPGALDLALLAKHLSLLRQGKTIEKPIYDFKTGKRAGYEPFEPREIIILEGLFALNQTLLARSDIKVFVDIGLHGRILRRLMRDVHRTGQTPADILDYFARVVEPMHEAHIARTKYSADMIVRNEYEPRVEAERAGMHEIQVKYLAHPSAERLRSAGVEKLTSTHQVDTYYDPQDRDLSESDEMVRLRKENERYTLTYKGPHQQSPYRKRPKFEFDIDKMSAELFLKKYGYPKKTIRKERTLYTYKGVLFSIDILPDVKDSNTFIEIRIPQREETVDLSDLLELVDADPSKPILLPYVVLVP